MTFILYAYKIVNNILLKLFVDIIFVVNVLNN